MRISCRTSPLNKSSCVCAEASDDEIKRPQRAKTNIRFITSSHRELQPNNAGPEGIDSEDRLPFDVGQMLALSIDLNLCKTVQIPRRTDRPRSFAVGQNGRRARTARRHSGPLRTVEGDDI